MEWIRPPANPPAGALIEQALELARAVGTFGFDPLILAYHPVARMNPYHALLYQRAIPCGVGPVPMVREERLREVVELTGRGFTTALHLHWLNLVLAHVDSAADARKVLRPYLDRLDR